MSGEQIGQPDVQRVCPLGQECPETCPGPQEGELLGPGLVIGNKPVNYDSIGYGVFCGLESLQKGDIFIPKGQPPETGA